MRFCRVRQRFLSLPLAVDATVRLVSTTAMDAPLDAEFAREAMPGRAGVMWQLPHGWRPYRGSGSAPRGRSDSDHHAVVARVGAAVETVIVHANAVHGG